MNYRHAYHAGNFADVHKHSALLQLLAHLHQKETPVHLIDTHAGIGRYDLLGIEAGKTNEAASGIGKLAGNDDPPLAEYLALARKENIGGNMRFYPGSPLILRRKLRPSDRLTLVELHPEDAQCLRNLFQRDRPVVIREEDAYQALRALLPPKERRGLVLIDPPYEAKDELHRLTAGLAEALRRWPTGIYAIWYPVKALSEVARFKAELVKFARPCFASELMLWDGDDETRLKGSGLAVINPPWQLDGQLESLTRCLHDALGCQGKTRLEWLVTE